jgi:hypothetical protein
VNSLMKEFLLMYGDIQFVYTFELRIKLLPKSCFSLTPLDNTTVGRNLPAALQHAVTVIFSLFYSDFKTCIFSDTFSLIKNQVC